MSRNSINWKQKLRSPQFSKVIRSLPLKAANLAERHFKESFRKKGFTDRGFSKWVDRKNKNGRGSLLTVSGALKRSVRKGKINQGQAEVIAGDSKVQYAQIHNEGGMVRPRVTKKMRKWAWAKSHNARSAEEKSKYRGLALTKKTHLDIKIPKRQYMGRSYQLNQRTKKMINKEINRIFQ